MLDGQRQRVDKPTHARTAHNGLSQERLERGSLLNCWPCPDMKEDSAVIPFRQISFKKYSVLIQVHVYSKTMTITVTLSLTGGSLVMVS